MSHLACHLPEFHVDALFSPSHIAGCIKQHCHTDVKGLCRQRCLLAKHWADVRLTVRRRCGRRTEQIEGLADGLLNLQNTEHTLAVQTKHCADIKHGRLITKHAGFG